MSLRRPARPGALLLLGVPLGLPGCADVFKDSGELSSEEAASEGGGSGGGGGGSSTDVECDASYVDFDAACPAGELVCGGERYGNNAGADITLDGRHYASAWACAVVGAESYRGPEQVFSFTHPGTGDVVVQLDSPCVDLDLFVARWDSGCLAPGNAVVECEGVVASGGGRVTIWNNEPARYVVIVDGPAEQVGNFGLSLRCPD